MFAVAMVRKGASLDYVAPQSSKKGRESNIKKYHSSQDPLKQKSRCTLFQRINYCNYLHYLSKLGKVRSAFFSTFENLIKGMVSRKFVN
jgi:hypothetical protein